MFFFFLDFPLKPGASRIYVPKKMIQKKKKKTMEEKEAEEGLIPLQDLDKSADSDKFQLAQETM